MRTKTISESGYGLTQCAVKDAAESFLVILDAITPSAEDLRLYFEKFLEEDWDEAGIAMQESLTFLRRAFLQLQAEGGWLLVFIS